MNRADVEMVNRSLGDLSQTLLRKKMMQQQDEQANADRGLRSRALDQQEKERTASQDIARERTGLERDKLSWDKDPSNPQNKHWSVMEDYYRNKGANDEQIKQLREINDKVSSAIDAASKGTMSDEGFTQFNGWAEKAGLPIRLTKPAPKANAGSAAVDTYREATALEAQAEKEADPIKAELLRKQAQNLRSSVPNRDPSAFVDETNVVERDPDTGQPVRTQKRRIPAGQAATAPQGGKTLSLQQAQEFLKQTKGDKEKARTLARQQGYTWD